MNKKIIFLNSHPIQYFAPLYQKMTEEGIDLEVWYCSDESIKGGIDREFGLKVKWDIPLLKGYNHRFFKNYSPNPSIHNGFFGLLNLGICKALLKEPKSLVIIHGWSYVINLLVVITAKLAGHQVGLRAESPLNQELLKGKKNLILKRLFFKYFLFQFINRFLFIGQQNKYFYEYFGVKQSKLAFVPYSVDNERFQLAAKELIPQKQQLRVELGLPKESKIILFSGKYIHKKRPLDLLKAYALLPRVPEKALVMVGEGELRSEMEQFILENNLGNVFLTGFVNQSEIVKYYAVADLFVMCSGEGETWGLSTNEAMNFGLPILLSSTVGSSFDLVNEGENGECFTLGEIDELAMKLKKMINHRYDLSVTNNFLSTYSYNTIKNTLKEIVQD